MQRAVTCGHVQRHSPTGPLNRMPITTLSLTTGTAFVKGHGNPLYLGWYIDIRDVSIATTTTPRGVARQLENAEIPGSHLIKILALDP